MEKNSVVGRKFFIGKLCPSWVLKVGIFQVDGGGGESEV